jgi:hypothetical protein
MFEIEGKIVKLQRQRVEMWSTETVAPAEGGREDSPLWLHSSIIFTVKWLEKVTMGSGDDNRFRRT